MYRSLAFYLRSDQNEKIVRGYNSRPREMINDVLQELQKGDTDIEKDKLILLLEGTITLRKNFQEFSGADYIIDSLIPFITGDAEVDLERAKKVFFDEEIKKTLEKSPATTSNVNTRFRRVKEIIQEG